MIDIRHIRKVFGLKEKETLALDDVSLFVPEGKITGIIGESGAGKSTLVRCINLLERPDAGKVYVDGKDMLNLNGKQLSEERLDIGMIFQHFNLLSSRTVFQNVALPFELIKTPKEKYKKRIDELLELVGLKNKSYDYPSKLSGGQKQRVAIARSLATHPKILLCDEATSALDPGTTRSILSLLREINENMNITILLITHEMEVVKEICDEVAVMDNGRLVESGKIADIFSHPSEEITGKFIDSALHIDLPFDYQERLKEGKKEGKLVIYMRISGNSYADSTISEVARQFGVDSNIVCAQMERIGGIKFGAMIIELDGPAGNEKQAVKFFKNKNISVEELGYV